MTQGVLHFSPFSSCLSPGFHLGSEQGRAGAEGPRAPDQSDWSICSLVGTPAWPSQALPGVSGTSCSGRSCDHLHVLLAEETSGTLRSSDPSGLQEQLPPS